MLRDKLNEYNFKTPFHKAKAAIYISGKRKGKSEKEIMQDMKDYFAKQAAIHDINKDRSVRTMSKRDQMFNSPIKDETFDIDFRELDDYDSYYDDFSRNNKQVDADDYDRYYSARFGYGSDSYVDERVSYKMNRNDKSLLERLTRKTYWVYLNGEYIADYRTLRGCLNYIERRKLEYNYDNDLGIIDNEGNEYHPYTGKIMNESINEWNFWDGDNRRSSSTPRQTRLIDVADKMRREEMLARRERYNNDPEYHNHIKRLEDELRRTDDPQHAEYLERRISKLRSLSEGVKLSRASRAINEMARKKKVYQVVAKCDYRDRSTEYVCDEFTSKREAIRYKKEECYDTPSRCHIIREVYVED
jgi:hypothetical protein